jgi:two-component system, LytTR family, sensor kinase
MVGSFNEVSKRYARKIKAVGIPLMIIEIYVFNYAQQPFASTILLRFFLDAGLLVSMWYIVEYFVVLFWNVFPSVKRVFWRVLSGIICGTIVGFSLYILIIEILINGVRELHVALLPRHMLFFSITIVVAYEVIFNFIKLSHAEQEREELMKSHLKSQLSSLKSQVNPHFLFNSLNTLLSLISSSPKRAEQFVEDLANVYRYLLQANEKEITTLEKELVFVDHYFKLLKTRYGNAISLDIKVGPSLLNHYIPSLTLQLLIENAVKHNIITSAKPLRIEIFTSVDGFPFLNVRNNLQQKVLNMPSTRMGLSNIIAKFNLLVNRDIRIISENGFFWVSIPLLNSVQEHLQK